MSDLSGFTPEQVQFITARLVSRTDKEAAEKCGINPKSPYKWENKAAINAYIESVLHDRVKAVRDSLEYASTLAVNTVVKLMKSPDDAIRLRAAQMIIEQSIGKPKQRQEITGANGGSIPIQFVRENRPE